eukprot:TRINITY_DN4201_c0_g1_i2.p2 TRINITY_DN4201_c0_g1~~TRINITY_DN4201_c0_g1_i2.p2  ORF type:complete len:212 (+),score=17.09 TRINITY_DN4201_c0_g1_i2:54-638(+)
MYTMRSTGITIFHTHKLPLLKLPQFTATSRNCQTSASKKKNYGDHQFEINEALVKGYESKSLRSIREESVRAIQGIGPKSEEALNALGVKTVQDLANWQYFKIARSMVVLEPTCGGQRPDYSSMNIDWAVDKEFEKLTLKEMVDAPVDAIQGLSDRASNLLKIFSIRTVRDLGQFKYCQRAEAICLLAEFEDYN